MKRTIEFDKSPGGLQGPIIDWYNTLRNTTVCNLELHVISDPADPPTPAVIVSLADGSRYRLQRVILKKRIIPESVDTIEPILPSDIGATSQLLVNIKFNTGAQPDLLFVLSVCYGTRSQELIFTAPQIVTYGHFFALALILNVTRKCLPHRIIPQASTGSPLELLWKDVYDLIHSQGYAFWAGTLAEHTKNMTRELLYKAAQGEVATNIHGETIDDDLFLAASAVARVEALAEKKELADPTVWDKAWDRCWRHVWRGFRPTNGQGTSRVMGTLEGISGETFKPIIDGRVPGRAAGRNPMRLPLSPDSITLSHAISLGAHLSEKPIYKGKGKAILDEEGSGENINSFLYGVRTIPNTFVTIRRQYFRRESYTNRSSA